VNPSKPIKLITIKGFPTKTNKDKAKAGTRNFVASVKTTFEPRMTKKIIIKKKEGELSLPLQKKVIEEKQKDIKNRLKKLEFEKEQLTREAQLNKTYYEYLEKLERLK